MYDYVPDFDEIRKHVVPREAAEKPCLSERPTAESSAPITPTTPLPKLPTSNVVPLQPSSTPVLGVKGDPTAVYRPARNLLQAPPAKPPFIIGDLLPQDAFVMAGAGGTGKSTLWLNLCFHVILNKPIWSFPIERPGPILYVSAEDDITRLNHRLYNVARSMHVTPAEWEVISAHFNIIELCTIDPRLILPSTGGNLAVSSLAGHIMKHVKNLRPAVVCFDPLAAFGPGERFINDGENAMIRLAKEIAHTFTCSVGYIHHVGKAAFRENMTDAHAGRGGSALGDGARGVYILHAVTSSNQGCYPGVNELYPELLVRGELLGMHIPKVTDAPVADRTLLLHRDEWVFNRLPLPSQAEAQAARQAAMEQIRGIQTQADLGVLCDYLQKNPDTYPSKRTLCQDQLPPELSRPRAERALAYGLSTGRLRESYIPAHLKHGKKATYIALNYTAPSSTILPASDVPF